MAGGLQQAYAGGVPGLSLSSVLLLVFAIGAGCAEDAPVPVATTPVAPTESAAAVRVGLEAAHRIWSSGDRAGAAALVRKTYVQAFEPLEPTLHAYDPVNTLHLEYAFGTVAATLSVKGEPVAVANEVRALVDAVDASVAALPHEVNANPDVPPPSPIMTTAVSPPVAAP